VIVDAGTIRWIDVHPNYIPSTESLIPDLRAALDAAAKAPEQEH
jgi:hypothetical protein